MERTTVTITGRVGSDVTLHIDGKGTNHFARFRLVSPRGRWTDDGQWEEYEGGWYTVKAWGSLAQNIAASLRKGQPIMVIGRPAAQAWQDKEGKIMSEIAINASAVGHDLARGVSSYAKPPRHPAAAAPGENEAAPHQPVPAERVEEPDNASEEAPGSSALASATSGAHPAEVQVTSPDDGTGFEEGRVPFPVAAAG